MRFIVPAFVTILLSSASFAQEAKPVEVNVNTAGSSEANAGMSKFVSALAADMAQKCPLAKPGDSVAFDACRGALMNDSPLRQALAVRTLWGRIPADPAARLKDYGSTQFAPEVLSGMYLPLFMFTGQSKVEFNETEGLYRAELGVAFRNQMQPGEFPYPFWHEENKWSQYQDAKTVVFWINPKSGKIVSGQFTPKGSMDVALKSEHVTPPPFDGKWTWTDLNGNQQPKLTLFDGQYSASNPFLPMLDATYKEFAMSLREGQCMSCHVPNNPDKMKKLVLMQSPRHAAAEINRIVDDVKKDKMPLTKWGVEEPLPASVKQTFLTRGEAFGSAVTAAQNWEKVNSTGGQGGLLKK